MRGCWKGRVSWEWRAWGTRAGAKKIKRAGRRQYVKSDEAEVCYKSVVPQSCLHTLSYESESAESKARVTWEMKIWYVHVLFIFPKLDISGDSSQLTNTAVKLPAVESSISIIAAAERCRRMRWNWLEVWVVCDMKVQRNERSFEGHVRGSSAL